MKKNIIIIFTIIIILIGIGFTIYTNKVHKTDAYRFKKEYESINNTKREKDGKTIRTVRIDRNNPMKYATEDDIIDMMDEGKTFLVYFGFSDCPWCRSVITNLIKVAKEKDVDTVYYVDVSEIRDVKILKNNQVTTSKKGTTGYMELIKRMENVLNNYTLTTKDGEEVDTLEKRIYAPSIVAVVNGEAEEMTDGISKKLTNPYMKLTDEINKESVKKIECIMKCLEKANVCVQKSSC